MREIKFRGKRIDNGEWVYGYLFIDQNGANYILDTNNDGDNGQNVRFILVDSKTVGQFTGLKNKNNTPIYEGDIVTATWYSYEEPLDDITGEIIYSDNQCAFIIWCEENKRMEELDSQSAYIFEIEVIGNILEEEDVCSICYQNFDNCTCLSVGRR